MRRVLQKAVKPDLRSRAILGRVVFGFSASALGAYSIFNSDFIQYAAPNFLPFGEVWVLAAGVILLLTGLMIIANTGVRKSAKAIALIWGFVAFFIYVPQGIFFEFFVSMGLVGGALLLNTLACAEDITEDFRVDAQAKE